MTVLVLSFSLLDTRLCLKILCLKILCKLALKRFRNPCSFVYSMLIYCTCIFAEVSVIIATPYDNVNFFNTNKIYVCLYESVIVSPVLTSTPFFLFLPVITILRVLVLLVLLSILWFYVVRILYCI